MVIPNYPGKPDEGLLLVAPKHRYMHRALTRLVPFLRWQMAQAWVHPRVHIYRQGGRDKEDSRTSRIAEDR